MEIWLQDKKTGIECGINKDGDLFLGDDQSGQTMPDTKANRKKLIEAFCKYTGREKPVMAASGSPIQYEGSMVEFSR